MVMRKDMSNEAYHFEPAISSSDVKTVSGKSLAHWKGQERKESVAFDLGTATHAHLLEPEKSLVRCGPETRRGKERKQAKEYSDKAGAVLLPEAEYKQSIDMAQSVLQHSVAHHLLTHSDLIAEASFFVTDPDLDLPLKTRPDGLLVKQGMAIDVKTCVDASPKGFDRAVRNFGYDIQAAFYLHCLNLEGLRIKQFMFICVEKEKPYAVCVHEMSEMYLRHAHNRMMETLYTIKHATDNEEYDTGWDEINTIHLPDWMNASGAF